MNFSLDIRWWIFILTIGQFFIECANAKKTYGHFNENSDAVFEPVTNNDRISENNFLYCPSNCKCLGDLADCSKNNLETIPNIPTWAREL